MDLDTGLLRAFITVAEHGNVGRAAQDLHLTQQGLSKRISRLEDTLGVRLFDRGHGGVTLTDAGDHLLPLARGVVDALDAATAAIGVEGVLTIDVMDEHSAAMELVRAASLHSDSITLETRVRPEHESLIEGLLSGAADVAFGRASVSPWPAALSRRVVDFEPLGLLVGAEHTLADRSSVAMSELTTIPLRFPLAGAPRDWVDYLACLAKEAGIAVDTEGCSLGFESFVERPGHDPEWATFYGLHMRAPVDPTVRVVPIVDPTPVFPWAVAWRRRWPASVVDELVGTDVPVLPGTWWMPANDRAWLGV